MPRRSKPDRPLLPDGFRLGVATSAFQIEGGLNGPGEPANNWVYWEQEGRVEPSGIAVDFWNRYEEQLDLAAALGCDTFRLGLEWARIEPEEGAIDETALDRYAQILDACVERGLEPLITLHHFTHPAWLGVDFWLSPESPERFAAWVERVLARLADRCRLWITFNEIVILAQLCYVFGVQPPGRRFAWKEMFTSAGHMFAAHVLAYGLIHEQRPDAIVHTNSSEASIYEFDRLFTDLLLARSSGVPRDDLGAWIAENGLCNRVRNGRSYERIDGWDRPRYLRENLAAVIAGLDEGLRIGAYLHWSLTDNYEWGSYQPRFGIHGVDRERGAKILAADSMGRDSAGAYRRLIEGLRSGDRSVLEAPD